MARGESDRPVQLDMLDRLMDDDPSGRAEIPPSRERSVALFRQAVRRNVEAILNTTRAAGDLPAVNTELRDSLWTYGFPDINSMSLDSSYDQVRLVENLESTIKRFEPRLRSIRVTASDPISKSRQTIAFRVEAVLMIDPSPERISFDTVLEVAKGAYRVKE